MMDEIDLKLLELLQKNARVPVKTLSREVRLSSPAVSARIARLERSGVIRGYTAKLDAQQIGCHIVAYIRLELLPACKAEFLCFAAACPSVMECSCVTGDYPVLLKAGCPSTQALDVLIGQIQEFGRTEAQIVLSTPVPLRGASPAAAQLTEQHFAGSDSIET